MLSRSSSRRRDRRHRLDALALHRHHQPGAIVTQWPSPIRVPNHADKTLDIPRKPRFNPLRATETHPNLLCSNWESPPICDSQAPSPVAFSLSSTRSAIQLLEVAVDAPLAERDPPFRGEIRGNARTLPHALVQRDHPRHAALEPLHALGKGVAQALDDLEQRQVDIAEAAAEQVVAAALRQHALEVAQELRHAILPEIGRAALRGRNLFLVVEPAGDRMMRVVDLDHEVGDGELQLMRPQPSRFVAWRQPKPRAEIKQDIGGLGDDELAGLEEWWRERRAPGFPLV